MSDPRMIPADEARLWKSRMEAARLTGAHEYRHWWTIVALHEQVEHQAAQIERAREALTWIQRAEDRAHQDWIDHAAPYDSGAALAYGQAARWIKHALGDNEESEKQ